MDWGRSPPGQCTRRTNPQMWHCAVPVSGSRSRKLAQPLVLQKSWLDALTAWVRRRIRRMAEARPVADEVAERDIMVVLMCAFWRAVIAVWRSAARPGLRSLGALTRNDGVLSVCALAGSVVWAL